MDCNSEFGYKTERQLLLEVQSIKANCLLYLAAINGNTIILAYIFEKLKFCHSPSSEENLPSENRDPLQM